LLACTGYSKLKEHKEDEMKLVSGQKGTTLIEVLIAIAILGMIAVPFLTALSTSSRALIIADERTTTESLIRSEIEYVRSQDYCNASWSYNVDSTGSTPLSGPPCWPVASHALPDNCKDYSLTVNASPIDGEDIGIRKITVTVWRDGEVVLTTSTYKARYNE
jgi:prepilin-type N-terminal cleavage/methylation domain-containing protein